MNVLIDNWYVLVGLICVGAIAGIRAYKYLNLPTSEKLAQFKAMLCELVKKAEEEIGSGKGQEKLEYVYSTIQKEFPFIVNLMSEDTFKMLVNGALYEVGIWLKK